MSQNVVISSNGRSVTLTHPEFEDVDKIEQPRIVRESRGGTKIVYRDPTWPLIETLILRFQNLSQNQVWDYLNFVNDFIAQEITMIDHKGITWTGYIINPDAEATQDKRSNGDNCGGFSIEMQFQGARV